MNSLMYITVMVLLWPHVCLEVWDFKGTLSPHPSWQFGGTAPWWWHCHSHMEGCKKKVLHTLLVETEIAIPFSKQSGNIYPNSKIPSLIKSSHAHMTTALFGVKSFNRLCHGQLRNSMQSWKRKKGGISTMAPCEVRRKQDAERDIWYDLIFIR